jgi:hypothetical protein
MADQQAQKKGLAHYLHKQWISTVAGAKQHAKNVVAERAKPVPARDKKGGKKT